jgi:hypothetical protein
VGAWIRILENGQNYPCNRPLNERRNAYEALLSDIQRFLPSFLQSPRLRSAPIQLTLSSKGWGWIDFLAPPPGGN